jgi:2,3-bisphosphoglycerate-dependent phosphoglycerate mutase
MYPFVLLRHGQSEWNQANRFTGWVDVDLTPQGLQEARMAGQYLRAAGLSFDLAYTSLLKRAIRSLWAALDALEMHWLPVVKTWRLNERHYGTLQGLDKAEMAARYGTEQVFRWRRSFDERPPALAPEDPGHPVHDPRYRSVEPALLPGVESLRDALMRVLPCWQGEILPRVLHGERLLVVAHGNSLRALVKHLESIPDEDIPHLNIPLGIPILYELDARGKALRKDFIGDPAAVRAAREAAARAAQVRGGQEK